MSCCSKLHDHGVFELLRGALGASDKLIETAVDAAKSDEADSRNSQRHHPRQDAWGHQS